MLTTDMKDSMTSAPLTTAPARGLRVFTALVGVTTLGIFLQAVTAGEFVSQKDREGWVTAHNIVANATIVVALVLAIVGIVAVRGVDRVLSWSAASLFALLVIQTALGHLITDAKVDGLIGVHVPLAFAVFALAIWLSVRSAAVRRRG